MNYIVNVPVCDLRREPIPHVGSYVKDPLQETQLLYGEHLIVHEIKNEWALVEAIEQPKWSKKEQKWVGYPGWIQCSQIKPCNEFIKKNLFVQYPWVSLGKIKVSFGTLLTGTRSDNNCWVIQCLDGTFSQVPDYLLKERSPDSPDINQENREALMQFGTLHFLETPYLWGGYSAFDPENTHQVTSVDCSALASLLYRSQGITLPRDARDQKRLCKTIEYEELQKADLIFLASPQDPDAVTHVMLYLENDMMLEATMDSGNVRFISGKRKFGKMLKELKSGDIVNDHIVTHTRLNHLYIN